MSYVLMIFVIVAGSNSGYQKDYTYAGTYESQGACVGAAKMLNKDIYRCLPTGDAK